MSLFGLLLPFSAFACAPQQTAPPPVASNVATTSAPASPPPPRAFDPGHVYRLDFVLTTTDGAAPPTSTAFALNLAEHDTGELLVGRNVPVVSSPATTPVRQDVGVRVKTSFRNLGEDLYLDSMLELSSVESPGTILKVVQHGDTVLAPGKSGVITSVVDERKRYELSVTPTKIR